MAVNLDSIVARSGDAVATELHGETVLMTIQAQNYFGLTLTSQDIWQRIAQPTRVRSICETLAREYNAPLPTIESDTLAFFDRLAACGLIKLVES